MCLLQSIYFYLVLLNLFPKVKTNIMDLVQIEEAKSSAVLSPYFYELINEYYRMIWIASIIDNEGDAISHETAVLDFHKNGFYNCDIMSLYTKINLPAPSIEDNCSSESCDELLNQRLASNCTKDARIKVDYEYGDGYVFFTENVWVLLDYMQANWEVTVLSSANVVTVVTGPCTTQTILNIEKFLRDGWFRLFLSHHIVLLIDCQVFAFYDVIIDKICWVDTNTNDTGLIQKLIIFETYNYKGYPIRLTLFERNPTLLSQKKLPLKLLPPFFKEQAEKMNGYSGMDAIIMSYAAERLNVTYSFRIYNSSDYGSVNKNGKYFGILGDIIYNKTDIAINTRFIKSYGARGVKENFEYLSHVFADRLCIVTPKSQLIPRWKAPLLIFTPYAWFGIFVMILFSSCFLAYIKRWEKSKSTTKLGCMGEKMDLTRIFRFFFIFIDVFLLILSAPTILPTTRINVIERVLLTAAFFVSFYLSGIFQAALTTSMSTINFDKDINTFEELLSSGLTIETSSSSLADLFGDDPKGISKALSKRYKLVSNRRNVPGMYITATYRNVCSVERENDAAFVINTQYVKDDGRPLLHVMEECPRVFYLASIVRNGWPFKSDFNRVINKFKDSGLIDKWYYDTQEAVMLHKTLRQVKGGQRLDHDTEPFTISQLIFSFYLLGIGLFVALTVFCAELLLQLPQIMTKSVKCKKKLRNRKSKYRLELETKSKYTCK